MKTRYYKRGIGRLLYNASGKLYFIDKKSRDTHYKVSQKIMRCDTRVDQPNLIDKETNNIYDAEEGLIEALKVSDRDGNGYNTVAELRFMLVNSKEKLTGEEVDETIRETNVDGGNLTKNSALRS